MSRQDALDTRRAARILGTLCALLVLGFWYYASTHQAALSQSVTSLVASSTSATITINAPTTATSTIGVRTKTSGCVVVNAMQDAACTPGAIFADATVEQICTKGYAGSVRDVPESEKKAVYAEYGILTHSPGEYEVDHLISLELGGSNDIANLWPEAAEPRPGFHEKDKVENYLHDQVCAGKMTLQEAQKEIAGDWRKVYREMQ